MSNEERQSVTGRDRETTAVGPFFNEASEETAQPVVPLAPAEGVTHHSAVVVPVPDYAARRRAPAWPLALIVVSLLTGLVGGVAGLWLYQRTRNAEARPAPAAEQASDATQAAPQETTDADADAQTAEPETPETETPAPVVEDEAAAVEPEEVEQPQVETRRAEEEQTRRERESAEAAPTARAPRDEERRGRDDDDDRDERPRETFEPRPGVVYDTQGPVDEGSAAARRAEREEQRLRRAERQRRREERRQRREGREERAVDSVRGIFEGQPPE